MKHLKKGLCYSLILIAQITFASNIQHAVKKSNATLSPVKKQFIENLAKKSSYTSDELKNIFKKLHKQPSVIHSMNKPFEAVSWEVYRSYFITPQRITAGVNYWKKHQRALTALEKRYQVPASILIAITGIETNFGKHLGKLPVANTLYTLAFYYPKRAHFFQNELADYLILAKKNHLATLKVKGSYAGALGIPQFMPSSYLHYAVSFSGKNHVDIIKNNNDALASIASYLKRAGFKMKQPTAISIPTNKETGFLLTDRLNKTIPAHQGINIKNQTAKLIGFKGKNHSDFWLIYPNFKAILDYNHSNSYAMVVYQLAKAIEHQYERKTHHAGTKTAS